MRQFVCRLAAEEQQQELKAEVTKQSKLIHEMSTLLMKMLAIDRPMTFSVNESAALFQGLVSELDPLYSKTDEVFRDLEFQVSLPVTYDPTWKWAHGNQHYIESATTMLFPFSFKQICDSMQALRVSNVCYVDAVAMKYHPNYRWELGRSPNLMIYCAARTYQEAIRTVIVWRALTEGVGDYSKKYMDEVGWFVIRPVRDASTCSCDSTATSAMSIFTVFESYARLTPMVLNTNVQTRSDGFAATMAKSSEAEIKEMVQSLEPAPLRCRILHTLGVSWILSNIAD